MSRRVFNSVLEVLPDCSRCYLNKVIQEKLDERKLKTDMDDGTALEITTEIIEALLMTPAYPKNQSTRPVFDNNENNASTSNMRHDSPLGALVAAVKKGNCQEIGTVVASHGQSWLNRRVNKEEDTLLHVAARCGYLEVVKNLVTYGCKVWSANSVRNLPLHEACKLGYNEMAQFLLEKGTAVDAYGQNGARPLHFAALHNHDDTVKLLLDHGADIDAVEPKSRSTPLHFAASRGCAKTFRLLLEKGADFNARDSKGKTPIDCAVRNLISVYRAFQDSRRNSRKRRELSDTGGKRRKI